MKDDALRWGCPKAALVTYSPVTMMLYETTYILLTRLIAIFLTPESEVFASNKNKRIPKEPIRNVGESKTTETTTTIVQTIKSQPIEMNAWHYCFQNMDTKHGRTI